MTGYFIRERNGSYFIVARYDDGTEETHVDNLSKAQAELELMLAGVPIRYEEKQLKFEL